MDHSRREIQDRQGHRDPIVGGGAADRRGACHSSGGDHVFSATGAQPARRLRRPQDRLRRGVRRLRLRLHDLRRTARTLLSRAGISADIAEMCLGHALGGMRGDLRPARLRSREAPCVRSAGRADRAHRSSAHRRCGAADAQGGGANEARQTLAAARLARGRGGALERTEQSRAWTPAPVVVCPSRQAAAASFAERPSSSCCYGRRGRLADHGTASENSTRDGAPCAKASSAD